MVSLCDRSPRYLHYYLSPKAKLCPNYPFVTISQIIEGLLQIHRQYFMFRVIAPGVAVEFDRWTDALNHAKTLMPKCQWFDEIRILAKDDLVWVYSRSHKFPQFIGPGTYDRLARLFIAEAIAEAEGGVEGQ
jgi:hypothetical protein